MNPKHFIGVVFTLQHRKIGTHLTDVSVIQAAAAKEISYPMFLDVLSDRIPHEQNECFVAKILPCTGTSQLQELAV